VLHLWIDNQVVLPQRLEDARPANRFKKTNMSFFVTSKSIGRGGDLGGSPELTRIAKGWQQRSGLEEKRSVRISAPTRMLQGAAPMPMIASGRIRG
jgi:hypothetical protein